jgi:hypothetical protein
MCILYAAETVKGPQSNKPVRVDDGLIRPSARSFEYFDNYLFAARLHVLGLKTSVLTADPAPYGHAVVWALVGAI